MRIEQCALSNKGLATTRWLCNIVDSSGKVRLVVGAFAVATRCDQTRIWTTSIPSADEGCAP